MNLTTKSIQALDDIYQKIIKYIPKQGSAIMPKRTASLDEQISRFIYNNNTCKHVVNTDQIRHKSIHRQRENLNALFIAVLMNCITHDPHFLIKQTSINNRLVFIITENDQDRSDNQSITQAHLVKDYLTKYIINLKELDLTQTSCSYDDFSNTFTLTTNIPSL